MTALRILLRRRRRLLFSDPLRIESATEGQFFSITPEVEYRIGRTRHVSLEALVDRDIREACEVVAKKCDADETARLAALLNADFGLPRSCSNGCYDQLLARFAVSSGEEARQAAVRIRADRARLARLRMLKDSLYAEPSLFVISRVEAQPDVNIDENLIREAWQLSALLKSAEAWWGPLMAAWSSLASNFKTEEAASVALRVLVDAIHRMDKKMASRYGIPGEAEFDDCGK